MGPGKANIWGQLSLDKQSPEGLGLDQICAGQDFHTPWTKQHAVLQLHGTY